MDSVVVRKRLSFTLFAAVGVGAVFASLGCPGDFKRGDKEGPVGGKTPPPAARPKFARFPEFDGTMPTSEDQLQATPVDYFPGMDGDPELTPAEIKGRNTWNLWTADNDKFWDWLANNSFGTTDFLKVLDTRLRETRFKTMGVVNEPGWKQADKPDEFGLWLDVREGEHDKIPVKVYGDGTGIVGLRLFPNPNFDEKARKAWDPERYYNDPSYYNRKDLVRPYRVGMSCGFCHVAPDPVRPPLDPEHPEWKNLSSYIGNQYMKSGNVFGMILKKDSFVKQLLDSSPRGTLDTSFIATDHINNPRTMNSLYEVGERLRIAQVEKLGQSSLAVPGTKPTMAVPHILKDGADSVGILGALARVFVNIGEHSDQWIKDLNNDALIGRKPFHPFSVEKAQKDSIYVRATANRVGDLAAFFLKAAKPHLLKDAPGGAQFLKATPVVLARGRQLFAENCASCHSSKMPSGMPLSSPQAIAWFKQEAAKPEFWAGNYLANDRRYSIKELGINANSPASTNAMRGHIWNDFSSETYKNLPAVGTINAVNPVTGEPTTFTMKGGGPGYSRVPTLVSLWASAPFFQNNALGDYPRDANGDEILDPSVPARMAMYEDSMTKLLWPEKRKGFGSIWRTDRPSNLMIPKGDLPAVLRPLAKGDYFVLGPIPAGTPVNLLGSIDLDLSDPVKTLRLINVVRQIKNKLLLVKAANLHNRVWGKEAVTDAQAAAILKPLVPALLSVNKCPDFVEDRGHTYGSKLPDADKRALIELLKTL